MIKKFIVHSSWFIVLSLAFIAGCRNNPLYKDTEVIMGTFVEVISPDRQAAGIVFEEIKRIDALMSKYKENSEISQLNRTGRMALGPDTFYVLKKAKEFWVLSNGAFDITVGPLMDLWGFTEKKYHVPVAAQINKTLRLVGTDKIVFNKINNVVKFKFPGMKIDLGGIAKGYAVDSAVGKLKQKEIKSCLINAGGQIYCLGDKPPHQSFWCRGKSGEPWSVAVRNPRKPGFIDYLKLKDQSVATSGDYEQYFKNKEKRYGHILDPKTGYPAQSGVISVTVIASDGLTADALSTAVFVLGKKNGLELVKRFPGVRVEIVEESDVQNN